MGAGGAPGLQLTQAISRAFLASVAPTIKNTKPACCGRTTWSKNSPRSPASTSRSSGCPPPPPPARPPTPEEPDPRRARPTFLSTRDGDPRRSSAWARCGLPSRTAPLVTWVSGASPGLHEALALAHELPHPYSLACAVLGGLRLSVSLGRASRARAAVTLRSCGFENRDQESSSRSNSLARALPWRSRGSIGTGNLASRRTVHASPAPFRMSSILRKPDTTAFSAHRRAADQKAVLCAAQQKRFGEPPRRAGKARLHHGHTGEVIMRNGLARRTQRTCSSPLEPDPKDYVA